MQNCTTESLRLRRGLEGESRTSSSRPHRFTLHVDTDVQPQFLVEEHSLKEPQVARQLLWAYEGRGQLHVELAVA